MATEVFSATETSVQPVPADGRADAGRATDNAAVAVSLWPVWRRKSRAAMWRNRGWVVGALLVFGLVGAMLPFERLPATCGMARLTGLPCPTCGATRTFRLMILGRWDLAFRFSPFAAALYLGLGGYLAYTVVSTACGHVLVWSPPRGVLWALGALLAAALALNYVYRLWMTFSGGFPVLPWEPPR